MDFNDATALMRLVQAVENDPYVSSGAGEALADKVASSSRMRRNWAAGTLS